MGQYPYPVHLWLGPTRPGLCCSAGGSLCATIHRLSSGDGMGIPTMEETDRPDRFVRTCHACDAIPRAPIFSGGHVCGTDRLLGLRAGDAGATIPFTC